jgi:flagellar basal body-associated protein FliL
VEPTENQAQPSAMKSFVTVAVIALVVCAALVGGAVFFLSGSAQLPYNYQGVDNK